MSVAAVRSRSRARLVDTLFDDIRARHPRSFGGVLEARAEFPERYADLADTFLGWAARAWGPGALTGMVDAFVRFTTSVNMSQARYERAGHYENKTFADCLSGLYTEEESMTWTAWVHRTSTAAWSSARRSPWLEPRPR